jgi:hypothetical protein
MSGYKPKEVTVSTVHPASRLAGQERRTTIRTGGRQTRRSEMAIAASLVVRGPGGSAGKPVTSLPLESTVLNVTSPALPRIRPFGWQLFIGTVNKSTDTISREWFFRKGCRP